MDAQSFGAFIAENRKAKGMTQAQLAEKLHVTDKAVSRWERGLGFPDINTIEPLAAALELSILELMRSEKITETSVEQTEAENVLLDTLDVAIAQRRDERKKILRVLTLAAVCVALCLAVDNAVGDPWMAALYAIAVVMPLLGAAAGVSLIVCGVWRRLHHKPSKQTFIAAAICFLIAVLPYALTVVLVLLGGFPAAS